MSLQFRKPRVEEPKVDSSSEPQEWDFPEDVDSGNGKPEELDFSVVAMCGASSDTFQLAGQTVGSARKFLSPILNIETGAIALVNGQEVEDSFVLQKNDRLEFVKKAGEKGIDYCQLL
ncbi:MAG: hypothetical protein ACE5NG_10155 [bacterium]